MLDVSWAPMLGAFSVLFEEFSAGYMTGLLCCCGCGHLSFRSFATLRSFAELSCLYAPALSLIPHLYTYVATKYSLPWYCKSPVMEHRWEMSVCRARGQSVPGRFCCCHPHHVPPEHGHAAQHFCHKRVPLHHATRPTVNANQKRARLQSSAHCSG